MSSSRQPGKIFEFVFLQLVEAGPARHDHCPDVEVVERVRHAVEQHAVVGDDLLALVVIAGRRLRIAAAEIAGRQHALRAYLVEHRLRREPHLREQPLGAAAGEIEHRVGILVHLDRIANDRNDRRVLDVEERARRALRNARRHRLVDEVDHLRLDRRAAGRRRRARGLLACDPAFFTIAYASRCAR